MVEKRTDLAIEIRESFPEDNVEIEGVVLEEKYMEKKNIKISKVDILDEKGARKMGKPVGRYVTLEIRENRDILYENEQKKVNKKIAKILCNILGEMKEDKKCYMVVGLGNRYATPDALGPRVLENIVVNRHISKELGEKYIAEDERLVCGIVPGVMAQTGMDTSEIIMGLVRDIKPECLIVVDALASRSVERLCRTIQITDTGISPGAGIGNNRKKLNRQTIGIPVIAIGVPTVVDASTIVYEYMEQSMYENGFSEDEIRSFVASMNSQKYRDMFVTPKDIDEQIEWIGKIVSDGMNMFFGTKQ